MYMYITAMPHAPTATRARPGVKAVCQSERLLSGLRIFTWCRPMVASFKARARILRALISSQAPGADLYLFYLGSRI